MSSNHFTRSEQNMIKFYPKISCWKCKKTLEICSHFVDWQSLFFRYFAYKAFDVCMCTNKLKLSFFCPLMSITLHRQSVFWPHPLLSMALGMNWRNFHCNFIVDVHNLFFSSSKCLCSMRWASITRESYNPYWFAFCTNIRGCQTNCKMPSEPCNLVTQLHITYYRVW